MHFGFSYAAQAALIEVDTNTGEVHVLENSDGDGHREGVESAGAARAGRGRDYDVSR